MTGHDTHNGAKTRGESAQVAAAGKMKALVYQGPDQKALESRPIPEIDVSTDAIVKITKTTICGTDLHILKGDVATCEPGRVLGHEGVGIVEKRRLGSPSRRSNQETMC